MYMHNECAAFIYILQNNFTIFDHLNKDFNCITQMIILITLTVVLQEM